MKKTRHFDNLNIIKFSLFIVNFLWHCVNRELIIFYVDLPTSLTLDVESKRLNIGLILLWFNYQIYVAGQHIITFCLKTKLLYFIVTNYCQVFTLILFFFLHIFSFIKSIETTLHTNVCDRLKN